MTKEEILAKIKAALANPQEGRNRMGCSEAFYDELYLIGECFNEDELKGMSLRELQLLQKLGNFASEAFY